MCQARNRSHRIEEQDLVRTTSARRSQTTASRHFESQAPIRLGTQDSTRRRTKVVVGIFPDVIKEKCRRHRIKSCITARVYSCHKNPVLYHGTSLVVPQKPVL